MSMSLNSTSADEIRSLERRVAGDPAGLVFARLADAYRKAGLLTRALEVVERGLHRHPDYLNARLVRARVLRDLGHRADAETAFEAVLEIDGSNQVALRALGDLAGETGDFAAARMWYARLLDAEPFAEEPVRALMERLPSAVEAASPSPAAGARDKPRRVERHETATAQEAAGALEAGSVLEAALEEPVEGAREEVTERSEEVAEEAPEAATEAAPEEVTAETAETEGPDDMPEESAGELITPTLAELYLEQGLVDEAIRIYERLMIRRPDDPGLAERLEAARARAASRPPARQAKARDAVPDAPEESLHPAAREDAPAGPSIRRYLDDLIEGRPGGDSPPASPGARFERWLRAIRGV